MSLFDIYKAIKVGRSDSLFASVVGSKLNKDAWKKGFNKWDEEWESGYYNRQNGSKAGDTNTKYYRCKNFIPCEAGTSYYFKAPDVHAQNTTYYAALFYNADKGFLKSYNNVASEPIKEAPVNAAYMTFYIESLESGATYQNDICINISGEHNGEYVPYDGE